jgi:hypothetical protein
VTQQHHGRYFAEGLIPHQRENTREQIQDALDAGEREVWHLVGVSNVLPELTGSQLERLEDELRRERQRRASSAGDGGQDASQLTYSPEHAEDSCSRRIEPRPRREAPR